MSEQRDAATDAAPSALARLGRVLVGVERHEWPALLLSFLYFFLVLGAYYVIRPVREQLIAISGSDALPLSYFIVFCVMLVLTPVYGMFVARLPRKRFVPIVYIFFILCLLAFMPFFEVQGRVNPALLGTVFFVWASVFNLFVVAVFWSFMADIFDTEQAHRLFGTIALGVTGAIAGSFLARVLVKHIGIADLLAVSAGMLTLALGCIFGLIAWSRRYPVDRDNERNESVIGGGILAGAKQVFLSPFLRRLALLMVLGDCVGTVLYSLNVDVGKAFYPDGVKRTEFFANVDLAANLMQVLTQITLTRYVLTRHGPLPALVGTEALKVCALIMLAIVSQPMFVAVAIVVTRSFANGMEKPASDSLYTRVDRETRYKAKSFIDTAVWRFGDFSVVSAMTALRAVGVTTAGFAGLSAIAAASAAWCAWRLRETRELQDRVPSDGAGSAH